MELLLLRVLRMLMCHCEQLKGAKDFHIFLHANASIFRFLFNQNITLYCFLFPAMNVVYEMFSSALNIIIKHRTVGARCSIPNVRRCISVEHFLFKNYASYTHFSLVIGDS